MRARADLRGRPLIRRESPLFPRLTRRDRELGIHPWCDIMSSWCGSIHRGVPGWRGRMAGAAIEKPGVSGVGANPFEIAARVATAAHVTNRPRSRKETYRCGRHVPGRDHPQDQGAFDGVARQGERAPGARAPRIAWTQERLSGASRAPRPYAPRSSDRHRRGRDPLARIVATSFVPGWPDPARCRPSSLAMPPGPDPTIVSVSTVPAFGFLVTLRVARLVAGS